MAVELETLTDNVIILSHNFYNGIYNLKVFRDGRVLDCREFPPEEHRKNLRKLWEDFFSDGDPPVMMGHNVTLRSLLDETFHLVFPEGYEFPCRDQLPARGRAFLYWLDGKKDFLRDKLDKVDYLWFEKNADKILEEIKKRQTD